MNQKYNYLTFMILGLCAISFEAAAKTYPFQNPSLPIQKRVADLVSRLTLEEKIAQMGTEAPAIARLGIPAYGWWSEALHGAAAPGYTTVFPQAIGAAATWDPALLHEVASAISDEGRAKYAEALSHGSHKYFEGLTFFSPNINIARDPRWGRAQETYGEDPYLTSRMAVAFVQGMQGDDPKYLKTVATAKHFAVHSGPESLRHEFNAVVSEHDLRETYLPAFEASVKEGHVQSVMAAYNSLDGQPAPANSRLLGTILRSEWGFSGYVVSDCGAINDVWYQHHFTLTPEGAAAKSVRAGTDLDCGGDYQSKLLWAYRLGMISRQEINQSVSRLFSARFRLGMFDPPEMVPYNQINLSSVDSESHRQLALKEAQESLVLLQNKLHLLPLSKDLKKIAVIGPNANDLWVLVGNYNGTPSKFVTPFQGIRTLMPRSEIIVAEGSSIDGHYLLPVPREALHPAAPLQGYGLKAEYFNNSDLQGSPVLTRLDEKIDFDWSQQSPAPELGSTQFSVRWTGSLTATQSGRYTFGANSDDGMRVYLNDKLVIDNWGQHGLQNKNAEVDLIASSPYKIKIEYFQKLGAAVAQLRWLSPGGDQAQVVAARNQAVDAAKHADVAIVVLGISPKLENEEIDRPNIELPKSQEELLKAVVASKTPVVLVLLNGTAIASPWASQNVDAILEAWYPGEEGGTALARALFGEYNPGGRLPVTFYRATSDLPAFTDYRMKNRTYRYFGGEALFPFGHGLSYTHFSYKDLRLSSLSLREGEDLVVSAEIQNAGGLAGDEVVQVYLSAPASVVPLPRQSLKAFARIHLGSGESQRVELRIKAEDLKVVYPDGHKAYVPGTYELSIGGHQPLDIEAKDDILKASFRL